MWTLVVCRNVLSYYPASYGWRGVTANRDGFKDVPAPIERDLHPQRLGREAEQVGPVGQEMTANHPSGMPFAGPQEAIQADFPVAGSWGNPETEKDARNAS